MIYDCRSCKRFFNSGEALAQHLRDSPVHTTSPFEFQPCDRPFNNKEALQQHVRDSPVHAASFLCERCNRTFSSKKSLQQHYRKSKAHRKPPETPLDAFFGSFSGFKYDPSLPPAKSYEYLREHQRWRKDSFQSDNAYDRYQEALRNEIGMWYGAEDDLAAWHTLCRAIGITRPLPETCKLCKKAVRRTHVNIVDLIEWGRRRENDKFKVQTFPSVEQLRAYTKRTGKIFRNTLCNDNGNIVLRHLLRSIFVESSPKSAGGS